VESRSSAATEDLLPALGDIQFPCLVTILTESHMAVVLVGFLGVS
jgi:hypothetical protein